MGLICSDVSYVSTMETSYLYSKRTTTCNKRMITSARNLRHGRASTYEYKSHNQWMCSRTCSAWLLPFFCIADQILLFLGEPAMFELAMYRQDHSVALTISPRMHNGGDHDRQMWSYLRVFGDFVALRESFHMLRMQIFLSYLLVLVVEMSKPVSP